MRIHTFILIIALLLATAACTAENPTPTPTPPSTPTSIPTNTPDHSRILSTATALKTQNSSTHSFSIGDNKYKVTLPEFWENNEQIIEEKEETAFYAYREKDTISLVLSIHQYPLLQDLVINTEYAKASGDWIVDNSDEVELVDEPFTLPANSVFSFIPSSSKQKVAFFETENTSKVETTHTAQLHLVLDEFLTVFGCAVKAESSYSSRDDNDIDECMDIFLTITAGG